MPGAPAPDVEARPSVLVLPVGAALVALTVTVVREVVPAPVATPLHLAGPWVLGLWNVRGEIVPLFDTAGLLGLPPSGAPTFGVVVETDHGLGGLTADGVPRVVELGDRVDGGRHAAVVAVHRIGAEDAMLVDVDRLLAAVRAEAT